MINTVQEFEESTAFELYVLETVCPAIDQNDLSSIDLRGGERGVVVSVRLTDRLSA